MAVAGPGLSQVVVDLDELGDGNMVAARNPVAKRCWEGRLSGVVASSA